MFRSSKSQATSAPPRRLRRHHASASASASVIGGATAAPILTTSQPPAIPPTTSTTSVTASATVQAQDSAAFHAALASFRANLSPEEYQRFQNAAQTGPESIIQEAQRLDTEHVAASRSRRLANRIAPLLRGVSQYFKIIGTLIQYDPEPSALVWGGILCVVQLAVQYAAYFESIIRILEEVGDCVKPLALYALDLYVDDQDVQAILVNVYGSILEICRITMSVFVDNEGKPKRGLRNFGRMTWQPYEELFGGIVAQFRRNLALLQQRASDADRKIYRAAIKRTDVFQTSATTSLADLRAIAERTRQEKQALKRKKILAWLSQLDFRDEHENYVKQRHDGTAKWIFDTSQYASWFSATGSHILLYTGKPGSGKTILTSLVIEELRNDKNMKSTLVFVYCDSRDPKKSNVRLLACDIIAQLCRTLPQLPTEIQSLYDSLDESEHKIPTMADILVLANSSFPSTSRVFVIVDAIDECSDSIALFEMLQILAKNVFVFVTSRSENRLVIAAATNGLIVTADPSSMNEDIHKFVQTELDSMIQNKRLVLGNPNLAGTIVSKLTEKADGMFLWAHLQLETLAAQTTDREVEEALEGMPYGLDKVYERALIRIAEQSPPQRRLAEKTLAWVVYSERALTVTEISEAVSIIPGVTHLDPALRVNDPQLFTLCCADLVIVRDGVIRTVHSSVQDFFKKHEQHDLLASLHLTHTYCHAYLLRVCLTYLMLDAFGIPAQTMEEVEQRASKFLLLDYITIHLGSYMTSPDIEVDESLVVDMYRFVTNKNLCISYAQIVRWRLMGSLGKSPIENIKPNPMQMAALFGSTRLVTMLFDGGYPINLDGENVEGVVVEGPLATAALRPTDSMIRHLLSLGAVDRYYDAAGTNALFWAVCGSNIACVNALLDSGSPVTGRKPVDLDERKIQALQILSFDSTLTDSWNEVDTLAMAAYRNYTEIGLRLLERLPDAEQWPCRSKSPVRFAVDNDNVKLLQRLLEVGFSADQGPPFPLLTAVKNDYLHIVRILILHGANIRCTDEHDQNILHLLTLFNKADAIDSLPLKDLIESRNKHGATALHIAADYGYINCIKILINLGADIDACMPHKETALGLAIVKDHMEIVKALLSADCNIHLADGQGYTALQLTIFHKRDAMFDILLQSTQWRKLDTTTAENLIVTAWMFAVIYGTAYQVRKLHEYDANLLNKKYDISWPVEPGKPDQHRNWTALFIAIHRSNYETACLLLDLGADVNLRDEASSTPLRHSVERNQPEIVEKLLSRSPEIDTVSIDGLTPLLVAINLQSMGLVKQLLRAGANPNMHDKEGWSCLAVALINGSDELAMAVLEAGAKPDSWSNSVADIRLAAQYKRMSSLAYMLPRVTQDPSFQTALEYALIGATMNDHHEVVDLLKKLFQYPAAVLGQALASAVANSRIELALKLLEDGPDLDTANIDDLTPLLACTIISPPDCVMLARALLSKGASIDHPNSIGWTPILSALEQNSVELAGVFLEHHARIDTNVQGWNTFHWIAARGQVDVFPQIAALDTTGLMDAQTTEDKDSPLHIACANGQGGIAELLLKSKVNVNASRIDGHTPLIQAISESHGSLVSMLLRYGAQTDVRVDLNDHTPLMIAAGLGVMDAVESLCNFGVDLHAKDRNGRTALYWACSLNNPQIAKYLFAQGVKSDHIRADDMLMIGVIDGGGDEGLLDDLLTAGASTASCDRFGRNALMLAISLEQVATVNKLLENGSDINSLDGFGVTAAEYLDLKHDKFSLDISRYPRREISPQMRQTRSLEASKRFLVLAGDDIRYYTKDCFFVSTMLRTAGADAIADYADQFLKTHGCNGSCPATIPIESQLGFSLIEKSVWHCNDCEDVDLCQRDYERHQDGTEVLQSCIGHSFKKIRGAKLSEDHSEAEIDKYFSDLRGMIDERIQELNNV